MNKLSEFYNYLEVEKRYSSNTINAYKRDLTYFNNYLKSEQIETIDDLIIKNYLASLYSNKASKKTIARKISSIRSFFNYLCNKTKRIPTNPIHEKGDFGEIREASLMGGLF